MYPRLAHYSFWGINLTNIPTSTTKQEISNAFKKYGEIFSIKQISKSSFNIIFKSPKKTSMSIISSEQKKYKITPLQTAQSPSTNNKKNASSLNANAKPFNPNHSKLASSRNITNRATANKPTDDHECVFFEAACNSISHRTSEDELLDFIEKNIFKTIRDCVVKDRIMMIPGQCIAVFELNTKQQIDSLAKIIKNFHKELKFNGNTFSLAKKIVYHDNSSPIPNDHIVNCNGVNVENGIDYLMGFGFEHGIMNDNKCGNKKNFYFKLPEEAKAYVSKQADSLKIARSKLVLMLSVLTTDGPIPILHYRNWKAANPNIVDILHPKTKINKTSCDNSNKIDSLSPNKLAVTNHKSLNSITATSLIDHTKHSTTLINKGNNNNALATPVPQSFQNHNTTITNLLNMNSNIISPRAINLVAMNNSILGNRFSIPKPIANLKPVRIPCSCIPCSYATNNNKNVSAQSIPLIGNGFQSPPINCINTPQSISPINYAGINATTPTTDVRYFWNKYTPPKTQAQPTYFAFPIPNGNNIINSLNNNNNNEDRMEHKSRLDAIKNMKNIPNTPVVLSVITDQRNHVGGDKDNVGKSVPVDYKKIISVPKKKVETFAHTIALTFNNTDMLVYYLKYSMFMQINDGFAKQYRNNLIVFNPDLHDNVSANKMYCIIKPKQNRQNKWTITDIKPGNSVSATYSILISNLPASSRDKCSFTSQLHKNIKLTDNLINKLCFRNLSIIKRKNDTCTTLPNMIAMIKKQFKQLKGNTINLMPIVRFKRNKHWIEHVLICQDQPQNSSFGVSFRFENNNCKITSVFTNKIDIEKQNSLIGA